MIRQLSSLDAEFLAIDDDRNYRRALQKPGAPNVERSDRT